MKVYKVDEVALPRHITSLPFSYSVLDCYETMFATSRTTRLGLIVPSRRLQLRVTRRMVMTLEDYKVSYFHHFTVSTWSLTLLPRTSSPTPSPPHTPTLPHTHTLIPHTAHPTITHTNSTQPTQPPEAKAATASSNPQTTSASNSVSRCQGRWVGRGTGRTLSSCSLWGTLVRLFKLSGEEFILTHVLAHIQSMPPRLNPTSLQQTPQNRPSAQRGCAYSSASW